MRDLTSTDDLNEVLREPEAVLLKHGAHCPISAAARDQIAALATARPELPIYRLEVSGQRALSDAVAERLGVEHESPQAFVLRDGKPVWRATHYEISAEGVQRHLDS